MGKGVGLNLVPDGSEGVCDKSFQPAEMETHIYSDATTIVIRVHEIPFYLSFYHFLKEKEKKL